MFSLTLTAEAQSLLEKIRAKGMAIVTAESCTGGLLSALLTEVPGSSDVFFHGWVTYANEAKEKLISVPGALIAEKGAVSEEVARAMAEGAEKVASSLYPGKEIIAVSITGIAGPGGGSEEKPVGTVHLAVKAGSKIIHVKEWFRGDREKVRLQAVEKAVHLIRSAIA